jgi:eukaryotic-like serine/threonine-protein kinase
VNALDSKTEIFDVFLCHSSEDKQAVREIAQELVKVGIKPWLDEDQIRPGTPWQTALGQQIKNIKSAAVFVGSGSLGPWQNQEIQAFLNQFVERECPVIPVVLPSAKGMPELPWTLENFHRVDFRTHSHPLERLIWGITGQKPVELSDLLASDRPATMQEVAKPRLVEGRNGQAPEEKISALTNPPDPDNATQLNILRRRVMEYWVDGVLKHSLYNEVLISLDKREVGTMVDAPWKYTVEGSDATNSGPLDDRDVSAIYDATGLLLILGEPGGGKTTTLLNLARTLLERARNDIRERVPIVVNLSSWNKKQPLAGWMSNELSEKYRVPRKIALFWLEHDYLLPLLDGLDEIETALQPDCVAAINAFIEEFRPSGLVVCCRLNEYRWLPKRLKLNGAICLKPLSSQEVNKYLDEGGPKLAVLREAIDNDLVLHELAETPLMLSIMSIAFQGGNVDELSQQKGNLEERRKKIFEFYVEEMFQRKGRGSLVFPKEKIIGWLSWLAGKTKEYSQSEFLVEGLQPSWLSPRAERVAYPGIVALSFGLIVALIYGLTCGLAEGLISGLNNGLISGLNHGLIGGSIIGIAVRFGCLSKSVLKNGIISGSVSGLIIGLTVALSPEQFALRGESYNGLAYGLIGGLLTALFVGWISGLGVGSLNHIAPVETIIWRWNHFWQRTIPGLILGLMVGLIVGLVVAMCVMSYSVLVSSFPLMITIACTLFFGTLGLVVGLVSGLISGFTDRVMMDKPYPNQGIKLSGQNCLAAFLVTCLIFELFFAPFGGLMVGLTLGPFFAFSGLIVCLNRGGSAVIKHYALRLILWRSGHTPLNFIKFLDLCAHLILLKKVGGGYIFIHRMLLEYFAELTPQSTKAGKTGSVAP